jgi:hypothetical protein
MLSNNNLPKFCLKYYCEICDYGTSKKSSYNDHLSSLKHQKSMFSKQNSNENLPEICSKFTCQNCNKSYKDNSGLWRHKKKCCIEEINKEPNNHEITPELIMSVLQQNKELNQIIIEQNKQNNDLHNKVLELAKNNSITNTINSHNKTFNLQFFLNETCKDAMNIMDFVDSIKLQLTDLEKVGKIGYIEGISSIIVKNLNSLDETKRPVHCTDSKREVMYVKDEDKWEKENETKVKLRKAIKHVAHKNSKMLSEFRVKNPDCLKSTSKVSDKYNKLVMEAMGGKGDNDLEKEDKIIKNIAKEVTIDSKV